MTIYGDVDEELRQRFAMLHLAWDEAYGERRKDPTVELRRYLQILGGVASTWRGVMQSKHVFEDGKHFQLDLLTRHIYCGCAI